MGQYHKFMNFDKKEILDPSNLRKLTEWSYQGNEYVCAVEKLMKTRWKGDRVLVVGDYVQEAYTDKYFLNMFNDIKEQNKDYGIDNIYDYPYKELKKNSVKSIPTRYIYNHNQKKYIDIKNQPIQWSGYDKKTNEIYGVKFHPLSLLLSCSNGHGGGDYIGPNIEYIGSWCYDSKGIELSDNKLKNDYQELKIKFDENKTKISNKEILLSTLYENFNKNNIGELEKVKFDPCLFLSTAEKNKLIEETKNLILTLSNDDKENEQEKEIEYE